MIGLYLAFGDHAGAGRRIFQERHFAANLARPNHWSRSLRRNLYSRGSFEQKKDSNPFLAFLNHDFALLESDSARLVGDQSPVVGGEIDQPLFR